MATWDSLMTRVLGYWCLAPGGQHAVKIIEADQYRLLVVSPRNYFVFMMLAASAVGAVEYRSITEPMRAANPTAGLKASASTSTRPNGSRASSGAA